MATIMNDAAYMGFPLSIKRGNPAPVDTTAVWYSKTELEEYAASGATAYVGQVVTLIEGGKCEAYMISNEAGTLVKLASTTASGDLASDVATLQSQVADLISKVGKAAAGGEDATGLFKAVADAAAAAAAADAKAVAAQEAANAKVASVGATDASVIVGGSATAPTVGVQLSQAEGNILALAEDGLKVLAPEVKIPEYTITEETPSEDAENPSEFSKIYHLTKDGVNTGVAINIPKDMVVSAGAIEVNPAGHPEGTYRVLTLANATSDKIYIDVKTLVDLYTGAAAEDGIITVAVSGANVITATIADGSITKAKLAEAVQTSLGKADSALQAADIAEGTVNGEISVNGTGVKVHGLSDLAFANPADYAAAGDLTALTGRVTDVENSLKADGATGQAIAAAKSAADAAQTAADGAKSAADAAQADVDGLKTVIGNDDSAGLRKRIATNETSIAGILTKQTELTNSVSANKAAIDTLNGDKNVVGSVANSIDTALTTALTDVIKSVSVGGTALTVTENAVNLALDTDLQYADSKLSIKEVNVNKLVQTDGDELILFGGNA